MAIVGNLVSEVQARWSVISSKTATMESRIFALLEIVCFPASFLTLFLLLPANIIMAHYGVQLPVWWSNWVYRILVSAAVGYLTNYIAIEMLFKPFNVEAWHPFSIMTFGYWKQGLVPKNKSQIAVEVGHQVEGKLLQPEALAREICSAVGEYIQNPDVTANIKSQLQAILRENEEAIVNFLAPQIEASFGEIIDKFLTADNIMKLWDEFIEPKLASPDTRNMIATKITEALSDRIPKIIELVKGEVRETIKSYIVKKLPLFAGGADNIASSMVDYVDWNNWENKLKEKLSSEESLAVLREEIQKFVTQFCENIRSDETQEKIQGYINSNREKLLGFLREYLKTALPRMIESLFSSPDIWGWLEESFMPAAKCKLQAFIDGEGKNKIIEKLNLSQRVTDAIDRQDVEQFYQMVNSVAAKHLGAIQVLGYLLGALVGCLQCF